MTKRRTDNPAKAVLKLPQNDERYHCGLSLVVDKPKGYESGTCEGKRGNEKDAGEDDAGGNKDTGKNDNRKEKDPGKGEDAGEDGGNKDTSKSDNRKEKDMSKRRGLQGQGQGRA